MDVKRMLCAGSIAAGVGLAGIVGAATANAAPTPSNSGSGQAGPSIKLDHHDRKEAAKQEKKDLKHNRVAVTPTTVRH